MNIPFRFTTNQQQPPNYLKRVQPSKIKGLLVVTSAFISIFTMEREKRDFETLSYTGTLPQSCRMPIQES